MSRVAILEKIRRALGPVASDSERRAKVAERIANPHSPVVPARGKITGAALLTDFVRRLEQQSASVFVLSSCAELPVAVAGYLTTSGAPLRIRMGSDPVLGALAWSTETGIEILRGPAEAGDQVGLSRAIAGVAETGTLVLASGPENPVTLTFLPETHLVVVAKSDIVGSYEDAFAMVRKHFGAGAMPRTLNLVSAPSRTGDIGGIIVLGAHGPRRLGVFVVS